MKDWLANQPIYNRDGCKDTGVAKWKKPDLNFKILQIANGIEIRTCFQNSSSPKPLLPRRSLIDERVCLASMTQLLTPYNFNFIYVLSRTTSFCFSGPVSKTSTSSKSWADMSKVAVCINSEQNFAQIVWEKSEPTRVFLSNIWVSWDPLRVID